MPDAASENATNATTSSSAIPPLNSTPPANGAASTRTFLTHCLGRIVLSTPRATVTGVRFGAGVLVSSSAPKPFSAARPGPSVGYSGWPGSSAAMSAARSSIGSAAAASAEAGSAGTDSAGAVAAGTVSADAESTGAVPADAAPDAVAAGAVAAGRVVAD